MKGLKRQNTPEIWGGLECTINRVGDRYLDQLELSGYYNDNSQQNALLTLGLKSIRFPVLWEKHQPTLETVPDFAWATEQLETFKNAGIEPIAGLLHHGSGPAFTNLLDEKFPELFASYARSVAQAFPWINFYTPVNEPLTTARFSGLYGLWYPHKSNDASFVKMLLNELKATVLAMREIRKTNPNAKFVQTEDLGKTYSTPVLEYQAHFENERRWLTHDILTGKFTPSHPLWKYFMRLGIKESTLQFFIDHPCVPDILGVNYYVTSERFLDDRIENYPKHEAGGNGLHQYVDVEAVRVKLVVPHGLEVLLLEMWKRYNLPIVITEAHLHCSREEQLRWLSEVYQIATRVKNEGVDLKAVTAWALLGSFGWNKLLTCFPCEYETGAYDVSAGYVRETATATVIRNLAASGDPGVPLAKASGWWKRESRYFDQPSSTVKRVQQKNRPIVVIGKTGTLGRAFARICEGRHLPYYLLGREEADVCSISSLKEMISLYKPWAIINATGFVKVDEAEEQQERCYEINALGVSNLATLCEQHNIRLVNFSSDLVFDGQQDDPYSENCKPAPINIYGRSKLMAEKFALTQNPTGLIIRTSAFFGPWDKYNFIYHVLSEASAGNVVSASADISISPTYVPHLVNATLDLLIDGAQGIWHLTNKGRLTWYDLAVKAVIAGGFSPDLIEPLYQQELPASRPSNSALTSVKYAGMPTLEQALEEYFIHTHFGESHNILTE